MPPLSHTHTYRRFSKNMYMCAHPHCTHRIERRALIGKASLCNDCGNEFILNGESLRRSRPRCIDCSDTAASKNRKAARGIMELIMPPLVDDTKPPEKDAA